MGQFIMPVHGGLTPRGDFDLMVHFHGHEPVRKEWVQVMDGAVLVGHRSGPRLGCVRRRVSSAGRVSAFDRSG